MTKAERAAVAAFGEQLRPTPPDEPPRVKPLSADDLELRQASDTREPHAISEDRCNHDRQRARIAMIRCHATVMAVAKEIGLSVTERDHLAGFFADAADDFDTAVIEYHGMERV